MEYGGVLSFFGWYDMANRKPSDFDTKIITLQLKSKLQMKDG